MLLVGVGVGDSKGEKLELMEGHPLDPSEGHSISTVSRSDMLLWDLISSISSVEPWLVDENESRVISPVDRIAQHSVPM